jgi:hypothetical protein
MADGGWSRKIYTKKLGAVAAVGLQHDKEVVEGTRSQIVRAGTTSFWPFL